MARPPTPEEFARVRDEVGAAPTFDDVAEVLMHWEHTLGVRLDEDQLCVIRDLAHQKPARD